MYKTQAQIRQRIRGGHHQQYDLRVLRVRVAPTTNLRTLLQFHGG